jgi:hypothetical protein
MSSIAQKVGTAMLSNMNQNPNPDIRELAAKWNMEPAQAFLRQQAVNLYRQKMLQDRQQQQQQQQQQMAQGAAGQQARPMPANLMPGGVSQVMRNPSLLTTAESYQAQQADAKQRADTGDEVVPVSQNNPQFPAGPGMRNSSPQTQVQAQAQAEQLRRNAAMQNARLQVCSFQVT